MSTLFSRISRLAAPKVLKAAAAGALCLTITLGSAAPAVASDSIQGLGDAVASADARPGLRLTARQTGESSAALAWRETGKSPVGWTLARVSGDGSSSVETLRGTTKRTTVTSLALGVTHTFTLTNRSTGESRTVTLTLRTPGPLGQKGRWNSTFADEFNGSALDGAVWTPHRGTEPWTYGHPYNASQDAYSFDPSRVTVNGGSLNLAWDPTPSTVRNGDGTTTTYPYTAGVAHSGKGFWFTEGYLEARIRFSDQPGLWPAFWLLPTPVDQNWPPEIDIAEMIPDDTPDGLYHPHFNYHWKSADGAFHQGGWKWYGQQGTSYAGGWHTYGLLRQGNTLQVFVDGVPGPSFTDAAVDAAPMYVVLSAGIRKGYDPGAGVMQVDYVRAWQR